MAEVTLEVGEEDMALAFSGPAIFANKTFVTLMGPVGRLSFVETAPGGAQFRTAVTMTIGDLLALRDAINSLADKVTMVEVGKPSDAQ